MLESIDTNVILRLIIGDNERQQHKATELLCRPDIDYYIDPVAITEVVFALIRPPYNFSRSDIKRSILGVFKHLNIVYEEDIFEDAFDFFIAHPKLSFVDCYLAVKAASKHAEPLWTFDRKLANQSPTAKEIV